MIKRNIFNKLYERLTAPPKFIQVVLGPRQVGKTTGVKQICESLPTNSWHYVSADAPSLKPVEWVEAQWHIARQQAKHSPHFLLIIDEIQKIKNWSEIVKQLYDEDQFYHHHFHVVLLGSSQSILTRGVTESLAGRCEILYVPHWSYSEVQTAFDVTLEEYIFYGGYPGSYRLVGELDRWRSYLLQSIIESTIAKDILIMNPIQKPALLRMLFELGVQYSGKILSYQKMLGQLQDAGNTTTLAHYLSLLSEVSVLTGLEKFAMQPIRQRASSPKFAVYNNALLTAYSNVSLDHLLLNPEQWGHWVESAVGSHILNQAQTYRFNVYYWRERNKEVDFILEKNGTLIALEVKSAKAKPNSLQGLKKFNQLYGPLQQLIIGQDGLPIAELLKMELVDFFRDTQAK